MSPKRKSWHFDLDDSSDAADAPADPADEPVEPTAPAPRQAEDTPKPPAAKRSAKRAGRAGPKPKPPAKRAESPAELAELWGTSEPEDWYAARRRRRARRTGRPVTMRLPAYLDDGLEAWLEADRDRTRTGLVCALLDAYLRDAGILTGDEEATRQ